MQHKGYPVEASLGPERKLGCCPNAGTNGKEEGGSTMREIKITIDGKEYVKDKWTLRDWMSLLQVAQKVSEVKDKENMNKEISMERARFISNVFQIPEEKVYNHMDFEEMMDIYREVDLTLTSAFLGTPLKRTATGGVEIVEPQ